MPPHGGLFLRWALAGGEYAATAPAMVSLCLASSYGSPQCGFALCWVVMRSNPAFTALRGGFLPDWAVNLLNPYLNGNGRWPGSRCIRPFMGDNPQLAVTAPCDGFAR